MNAGQRILKQILPQGLTGFKWEKLRFSPANWHAFKYRPFLILLVITVMAYLAVGIFYKVLGLSLIKTQAGTVTVEVVAKEEPPTREPLESFNVIVERNLFGSTDKIIGGKPSADKAPPAPDLSTLYDLRGTVAGNGRYGFAILEEKSGKKQRLYKVGDALSGGRITKIMRNAIAVKVGAEEKIMKIAEKREAPMLPPSGMAGRPTVPVGAPAVSTSGSIVVDRSDLTDRLNNVGAMLSQAQIRPYFSMGAPDGFVITNIRPGSIYQKLGIANGDIIQGVNDQKIRTADDMMALYNKMKGANNITLNIKRQDRQDNLNYVFK